jgi:hypothetical protein
MKNVIKLTTVIALFIATTINAANVKLGLTPNAAKTLTFSLNDIKQETTIKLIDAEGKMIYTEGITAKEAYIKRFDLGKLEKGNFYLEVENELRVITYDLELGDTAVVIKKRKEKSKPVFREKGSIVFLNLLNLEKKTIRIKVVDSLDRVVFEETVKDEAIVEKVFNFEDAFEDKYTLIVSDNKETYYKNISIK